VAKRLKTTKKDVDKNVETLRHTDDKRLNIPTAEHQSVLEAEHVAQRETRYPRNTDLDPQLVWRGKDYQDWSDLVIQAPPLYIQEKVHPKVLVDDLLRESRSTKSQKPDAQIDLFADFNGVAEGGVLPTRGRLDEPVDPRRLLGGDDLAARARAHGRASAVHLRRPAVRHQVQQ